MFALVVMHKYEIDIFWNAEDDRYIAVVSAPHRSCS